MNINYLKHNKKINTMYNNYNLIIIKFYINITYLLLMTFVTPASALTHIDGIKNNKTTTKHFNTIWEGNPYNRNNIWISNIYGYKPSVGDEIAVFDGSNCVGSAIIYKIPISNKNLLIINCSKDDGSGNGFINNHQIHVVIWNLYKKMEIHNITIRATNIENNKELPIVTFKENSDYLATLTVYNIKYTIYDIIDLLQLLTSTDNSYSDVQLDINNDNKNGLFELIYMMKEIIK